MNLRILKSGLFVVAVLVLLAACSSEEAPVGSGEGPEENPQPVQENLTAAEQPQQSEEIAADEAADPAQAETASAQNAEPTPAEPMTSVATTQLPEGPGKKEFELICSQCHAVNTAISLRRSPAEWRSVIEEMLGMGADATDAQAFLIFNYLTQNFGL